MGANKFGGLKCGVCRQRARADGSCKNEKCTKFRTKQTNVARWQAHHLQTTLGSTADHVGAYVAGGFAVSLQHRHDIRVGIASGMLLRSLVPDVATRLALLAAVFPSYWGWSTSMVLEAICARMNEFLRAQPLARAELLEEAWTAMSVKMANYQVVGFRGECEVALRHRTQSKRLVGKSKGCFCYHPFSKPASRRTGLEEFDVLLPDLRSGSLWRACEDLASLWRSSPTYAKAGQVLRQHKIALWAGNSAKYNRTRLVTL